MVSKKTSSAGTAAKEDKAATVQKAAKKPVAVKTAAAKKPAATAKTAAKTATVQTKSTAAKAKSATAKSTAASKENAQLPVTENRDIVMQVADIKAKNEEKKARKTSGSAAQAAVPPLPADNNAGEKGKKATGNSKRAEVLENAKIAEAKKFMEMKENPDDSESVCNGDACCQGGAFCSWVRAYKNIFNFKGRTSRFEFWSFMLINMFAISLFSLAGQAWLMPSFPIATGVLMIVFYIAEVIVYLSVITRRLHDGGYTAWKGFFRPCILNWLAGIVLLIALGLSYEDVFSQRNITLLSWLGGFMGLFFLIYLYYCIKIFVAAGFYEEENGTNAYGAMTAYCDKNYKQRGLRYSVFYLLLLTVAYTFYFIYIISMTYLQSIYY